VMSEVFCNITFCKFNKGGCCTAPRIVVIDLLCRSFERRADER